MLMMIHVGACLLLFLNKIFTSDFGSPYTGEDDLQNYVDNFGQHLSDYLTASYWVV